MASQKIHLEPPGPRWCSFPALACHDFNRTMKNTRRTFMMTVAAGGAALALASRAQAADMLDEKSPQAAALGYVADTTKADGKKYPKHTAEQGCHNCALFQGKAADAAGGCALFPGKQVASKGWCSAWNKKA
jgi:hypothetical protein